MRPVNRGATPGVIQRYEDAKPMLTMRIGHYCSYCERPILALLAVEHVQPKALPQYAHLECEWTNLLLGCVNCNSAKKDQAVERTDFFLPDWDNTFRAFAYLRDGIVVPAPGLTAAEEALANATIELVALNRKDHRNWTDPALPQAALERWSQRVAAWVVAEESLIDLANNQTDAFRRQVVRTAMAQGFFSIWMRIFGQEPLMLRLLVDGFPGTALDCFSVQGTALARHGGKL